jgi:Kef-type K+ transport system membrane component KefB
MNRKIGMYSSLVTCFAVFAFALCMLLGIICRNYTIESQGSYFSSIFIALGYTPMVCAYFSFTKKENKSAGIIALSFAIMYGILITIVYYTQLTTVRLSELSEEAISLLDYSKFGLFFNYNLLGYMFMALSTFFIGITLDLKDKKDNWLKKLLCIHGIFALTCFTMPVLGVFNPNLAGARMIGLIILEFWCIYFMPICILSYIHFKKKEK